MSRESVFFEIKEKEIFIEKLINYGNTSEKFILYNSNNNTNENKGNYLYGAYDLLACSGELSSFKHKTGDKKIFLKSYIDEINDWCFGFFAYDYKNSLEKLDSANFDGILLPDAYFFVPELVFILKNSTLEIQYLKASKNKNDNEKLFSEIINKKTIQTATPQKVNISQRIEKKQYLEKVNLLKKHIKAGNIYEANFCMEFFDSQAELNPAETYKKLNKLSPTPFSVYGKFGNKYLLSASPERYLKKQGLKIISQPIKGTSARSTDKITDAANKEYLTTSLKERAENIMITDLVRNDLSRTAAKGSVKVEELCGVYAFKQVYQLISTISSELKNKDLYFDVIEKSFPPGSMTGAPKIRAMQIIEELEETKRGLYSGSVGYFTPEKDFDFNVVIRSILYNADTKFLSYSVGGAITHKSTPEAEYDECMLKALAIKQVLEGE